MIEKYVKLLLPSTYVCTINLLTCIFPTGTMMVKVPNYKDWVKNLNGTIAQTHDSLSLQQKTKMTTKTDESSL